VYMT